MPKKPRTMRTALRAASKVQERGLQAKAEKLQEDPSLLIPRCHGHATHFARAEKALRKAQAVGRDLDKLKKIARWSHPWAKAYAATLLGALRSEDAQVIMLQVPTPFGTVPVASRGKAKRDHLVGVQYFDDRKLRLLLVLRLARKGLVFYSMPDGGIACGGKQANPPPKFVEAEAESLDLIPDPEGWGCPHAVQAAERLVIRWKPAGVALRKCAGCASQGNTLATITQHIAGLDVLSGFGIAVELEPLEEHGSKPVALPDKVDLDAAALDAYRKGSLDDAGLLRAQRAVQMAQLRNVPGPLLVHGAVSYGSDLNAFIASLNPTPVESLALQGALRGWTKPVIHERGSPTKVLTELWEERGAAALAEVAGSDEVARDIMASHDVAARGVGPALQMAQARGQRRATDSALPSYQELPPPARLSDAVARAHRSHGKVAALAVLEQSDDPRLKGLVHAFERALGASGREWKYAPLEQDLARQLEPQAAALLRANPEQYHDALQALSRAAGATDDLRRR